MSNQEDLEQFRKKWLEELQNKAVVQEQPSGSRNRLLSVHTLNENATKRDDDSESSDRDHDDHDVDVKEVPKQAKVKDVEKNESDSDSERSMEDVTSKSYVNNDVNENSGVPAIHGNYVESSRVSDVTPMYFPFRVLSKILNQKSWEQIQKVKKRIASEATSLVTSPKKSNYFKERSTRPAEEGGSLRGASGPDRASDGRASHKQGESLLLPHTQRFLDLFIADLNEISEIPFFDNSIPREVAIKIFWHLDVVDLCRCAQVSRSWQSLAQDELLWCRICHRLGFEQGKVTVECSNWKSRVRHYTILKRTMEQNWKNRTGKLHNLHHVKGGVLCAASSFKSSLVAGYSNCQTKLWNVSSGETCIFQPSSTALIIDENTEGPIVNEVLHVATCSKVTAASYTYGFVDVWSNEEGTSPVYTVPHFGPGLVSAVRLWEDNSTVLAAVTCGSVLQVHEVEHRTGSLREQMDFELSVTDAAWMQSPSVHSLHTPVLAVATQNTVSVGAFFKKDMKWFEIHNIVDAPVTCLDARLNPCHVAVGFSVYSYPCELIKVNVYDVTTQQLVVTLSGHTSVVSCVNMSDSPPHQMVSGSRDRKVRVYDTRVHHSAVMTLIGHSSSVTCVQMDDDKVVSGDDGGFVCVWDQRTVSKLWEMHDRHPVTYCHFDRQLLAVAHKPVVKQLQCEYDSGLHQRHRGSLHVYDFLADQTTKGVPDICLSTFDEPHGYNYNIQLAVPYDQL